MKDTDLDELLDKWSAPEAPASLRERVRAGFGVGREQKAVAGRLERWGPVFAAGARKGLLVAGCVAAGALLFSVSLAFPQNPARPPFTVESEMVTYTDDGSAGGAMRIDSYSDHGREVVLSRWYPGNPLFTALSRLEEFWQAHVLYFAVSDEKIEARARLQASRAAALIQAGCVDGEVVSYETILGYPTVAVQHLSLDNHRRMIARMAPDLGCFPLRVTMERQRLDGTFRLVMKREALKVTVNR
jgi:hypothetical protein